MTLFLERGPFRHFFVWLVILLSCFVSPREHLAESVLLASGLAILMACCAGLSATMPRPAKLVFIFCYGGLAVSLVMAALAYGYFIRNMGLPEADAVRVVAQTDFFEAMAFLLSHIGWLAVLIILSILAALFITYPKPVTLQSVYVSSKASLVALVAIAGFLIYAGGRQVVGPTITFLLDYRNELDVFREALASRAVAVPEGVSSEYDGTMIVIIGESTTRHHMGLYHYFRETTPRLSKRKDELFLFQDVISNHSHTVEVLTKALTLAGTDEQLSFYDRDATDVVTLAKAAGFETYWYSNQNEFGLWDNPVSLIAKNADKVKFFSPTVGKVFRRPLHDGAMLPLIEASLSEGRHGEGQPGRRVVFVHLFATHIPYCGTYPASFGHFEQALGKKFFGLAKTARDVNCYDNSVRYVDWMLDEIIRLASAHAKPVGVIYFSDHGEAPLLGTGHEAYLHSSYHLEVPLFVWLNKSYRERHPESEHVLSQNADSPYILSRLFHTLADLMRIEGGGVDDRHSLLSRELVEQDRIALGGEIFYDKWSEGNDYRENARIFMNNVAHSKEKIWAHRINSLGALFEARKLFSGIEIDLVYSSENQRFRVYHSPAPDVGLTLVEMLEALTDYPETSIWLDWKNASAENVEIAVARLEQLDRRFQIKDRILVETGSDAVFDTITAITSAGFRHGYYLPTRRILACMEDCSPAEQQSLADGLASIVERGEYTAITYDWRLRPFVEERLGDFLKRENLQQFSWDMSVDVSRDIYRASEISTRAGDLSALLVVFPSVFKI